MSNVVGDYLILSYSNCDLKKLMSGDHLRGSVPQRCKHQQVDDHVDHHRQQNFSVDFLKSLPVFPLCSIEHIKIFQGIGNIQILHHVKEFLQLVSFLELFCLQNFHHEDCQEVEEEKNPKQL